MSITTETEASIVQARPLSLTRIDFADLYARHLCRHSQFGINVAHLAAPFGVRFGAYGFVDASLPEPWLPVAMAAAYLLAIAPNLPVRVTAASAVFLAAFVSAVIWLPLLPFWAYLIFVLVFYKLQTWSHKVFTTTTDMTEFNQRFPKGQALFWVLLVFGVPFLLNYLVFDRKKWSA